MPSSSSIQLPEETRTSLITILNARLADTIDLYSQLKQAHWMVRGPHFIQLHTLFDDVAEVILESIDLIAERIRQLGGAVQGTVRMVASKSNLPEYPQNLKDLEHVRAVSHIVARVANTMRLDIERTADLKDAVTSDILTEITRHLDVNLWKLEAHVVE